MMIRSKRVLTRARACVFMGLSSLLLAGCGGGGGGGDGPPAGGGTNPPPTPTPPPTVTIVGTAATGAPLAGAAIELKCAHTSIAAHADADGHYRIDSVPGDAAPCLLRARQASVAYVTPVNSLGVGTITVNATPLTHLLSSRLLGEPADRAFQNATAMTFSLVDAAGISAARGRVRAQIDRLGITVPGLSSDWIGTSFKAQPGDPQDDLIEALHSALASHGLTVASAATQLASNDAVLHLPPGGGPVQACTPALIDGFSGADRSKWTTAGVGPAQADAIGIGGGPGLARGASVEISFADGTVLGPARTDSSNGMVTLVPCGLKSALPALIRMHGGPGSTYYDAGTGQWASFEGRELRGLVSGFEVDRNLAVTPFTEAAYQRVLALGTDADFAAGRFATKAGGLPWRDSGLIEIAHDEVLAAVNDQLPGVYRLERLDHMPLLLDDEGDTENSQALPKTPDGIHGAIIAGLARTAAANRPDDPAPALAITERFAADMADGLLDDPLAGLDPSQAGSTLPAYSIDSLWRGLTTGTTSVAHRSGRTAFRSDLPFPLALVNPSNYRVGDFFGFNQYIGLFSDGVLRVAAEVPDHYSDDCGDWCNPVRKVRASPTSTWWVFEIGRLLEFDPDNRIGRLPDGRMALVGIVSAWAADPTVIRPVDFAPLEMFPDARLQPNSGVVYRGYDGGIYRAIPSVEGASTVQELAAARGLRSLAGMGYSMSTSFVEIEVSDGDISSSDPASGFHLFGIDAAGQVQRLVYQFPFAEGGGIAQPVLRSQSTMPLPARARQLSSDGRLVHALLNNGEVHVLNPEIIAAQAGSFPIEGAEWISIHFYRGNFAPTSHAAGLPVRVEGAPPVCRIGGAYLHACDGRLLLIDREYHWHMTGVSHTSIRAPGAQYIVRPVTGLDERGWRAHKAPMSLGIAGEAAILRLLVAADGSYVLRADTHGVRLGANSYEMSGGELTQRVIESWLSD